MGVDAVPDGLVDAWRLWRHCLCRFGWYPLFVAPLVTCACILDVFSSTGCDFVRVDIGFVPINDEWQDSRASLGLFSFDSHETDKNKWKRSFNNGCQPYSEEFTSSFMGSDQSWQIARILAHISGISSAIACATVWLLTITPLPASFFWPGVLLPAVVLAMATGAAKFIFFDAMICSEDLWYMDESSPPVPPQSCEIGESAVFGIASTVAYFLCTILICFKSPRKRKLDENFGKSPEEKSNSQNTNNTGPSGTDIVCHDIETGDTTTKTPVIPKRSSSNSGNTIKANNTLQTPEVVAAHHIRTTSDVTWEGHGNLGNLGILSPIYSQQPQTQTQKAKPQHSDEDSESAQSIVMVINDTHSRSYSDGSSGASLGKFQPIPNANSASTASRLPPRHNGKTHRRDKSSGSDPGDSLPSKVSKLSYADTHCLSDPDQQSAASSQKDTPLVVAIPNRKSSPSTKSAVNRLRFVSPKKREDRNDSAHSDSAVQKREKFEYLPPLEEDTPKKNTNDDHGDLINKCLQDLELSFVAEKSGYDTL
mmetsp:Transcript_16911/g.25041  ORF Transcript_16911/g.25041 Transcript_16911/m.25041 type:complete len:536 (-) Transcript_16911:19-1626(-)